MSFHYLTLRITTMYNHARFVENLKSWIYFRLENFADLQFCVIISFSLKRLFFNLTKFRSFYFELASCPQTLQKYDTPSLPNLELHQCFEQFSCHLTPCNKNIIEKDISTMQPSHVNTAIFAPGLK